jgi:hypothetical protein
MTRNEWRQAWQSVRLGHDVPRDQRWIVWQHQECRADRLPSHRKPGDRGSQIKAVLGDLPLTTPWFFYPIPLP